MLVYSGRLEDILTKILNTAKTTFKNVAKAMIVKVLFKIHLLNPQSLWLGIFILVLKKPTISNSKLKNQNSLYF